MNVTALPDPEFDDILGIETQRFPILLGVRNEGDNRSRMGIRNASLSPLDYTEIPEDETVPLARWIATEFSSERELIRPSRAKDHTGASDARGAIGASGNRLPSNNDQEHFSSVDYPFGFIQTEMARLELKEGLNFLVIEPVRDDRLPNTLEFDSGWQLRELRIGPNSSGLQGEVVSMCGVSRLHTGFAVPGKDVHVQLAARNITGPTTITETYPEDWTVADAGGGVDDPAAGTLTFTIDEDVPEDMPLTYTLRVPEDFCDEEQQVKIAGTFDAGEACDGPVFGGVRLFSIRYDRRIHESR